VSNNDARSRGTDPDKITIYFGCSMLGGYGFVKRKELAAFPGMIRELGYGVASDHQTRPGVIEREAKMAHSFIHDRDYRWLLESHLGIFEISNPSLGVGGEISDMVHLGKPVLLLFRHDLDVKVSAYIRGKSGSRYVASPVACQAYENLEDARTKIRDFIAAHHR